MKSSSSFRSFSFYSSPLSRIKNLTCGTCVAVLLGFTASPSRAESPIVVNIDGRVSTPDPAPLLSKGAVFVPLRGVLENLGANVEYAPAESRIDITQNGKKYSLRPGTEGATVDAQVVPLAAAKIVGGRAFVPLRSLAELFGYRVAWLNAQRTVAIYTTDDQKPAIVDHRLELKNAGAFGVEIDFSAVPAESIVPLLDAAKKAGAGLVKTRFDWSVLQPTKGSDFQWTQYDSVVREARKRGLRIVGILGNSTQWASVALSKDPDDWSHSPPKEAQFPAWSNYVKRVVGRYRIDVQAWQVWENPSAVNFRSVARTYRKLARLAVDAAHLSDPNAIVHAAEPGGVELDFINDLTRNGLTPSLDGVQVFPVAQWQPGVPNPTENFVLPYATLRDRLQLGDGKTRDYWVGGVSTPSLELPTTPAPATVQGASLTGQNTTPAKPEVVTSVSVPGPSSSQPVLLSTYSPTAQADYLVRIFALALAGGAEKVFWGTMQDGLGANGTMGILNRGLGLIRGDGVPRPSFNAFQLMAKYVDGKPYAGNLSFDSHAVALLFDDKKSGTLVAWSPEGNATLTLSSLGTDPHLAGATFVATRPDSQVLDAAGTSVAAPDGVLKLTNRPLFITNVALQTATAATARQDETKTGLRLSRIGTSYAKADEVKATFHENGGEDGLFWRQFRDFGGMARSFRGIGDQQGLSTESQRDIFDLTSSRPFIYLDVADDFMYFTGGTPVTITVTVQRPPKSPSSILNSNANFRIEYDSPNGYRTTPLQEVEEGEGWATYSFTVPDATFANAEGYDLLINAGGSKRDLNFGSITVRRAAPKEEKVVS